MGASRLRRTVRAAALFVPLWIVLLVAAADGTLQFLEIHRDGVASCKGLGRSRSVGVSPDGAHVYVREEPGNAVSVFERDPATGLLLFTGVSRDAEGGIEGLGGGGGLAVSPDGAHLYLAGAPDGALTVFAILPDEAFAGPASETPTHLSTYTVGDCNGDSRIPVNELVLLSRVALALSPREVCRSGDVNGDGGVTIDELVRAVRGALGQPTLVKLIFAAGDAFAVESDPENGFGDAPAMYWSDQQRTRHFVQFDAALLRRIVGVPERILRAEVGFYVVPLEAMTGETFVLRPVRESWSESGLSWFDQPNVGSESAMKTLDDRTDPVRLWFDVSPHLRAALQSNSADVSWRLSCENQSAIFLTASRETTIDMIPVLKLTYVRDAPPRDFITLSADGRSFESSASGDAFVPFGVNYDRDIHLRLLEQCWEAEWGTIEADFKEMAQLGWNTIRIHLQLGSFFTDQESPNWNAYRYLDRLVQLADQLGLELIVTGLGFYNEDEIPDWYRLLDDEQMIAVQHNFWERVSQRYPDEEVIFSYDLQNEPFIHSKDTDQIVRPSKLVSMAFEYGHYRQISGRWTAWVHERYGSEDELERAWPDYPRQNESWDSIATPTYSTPKERRADFSLFQRTLAHQWTAEMVGAIREYDSNHMLTIGLQVGNLHFTPPNLSGLLSYSSLHLYCSGTLASNNVDSLLSLVEDYSAHSPVVIEEVFPLVSDLPASMELLEGSRDLAAGWLSFYWGMTPDELREPGPHQSEFRADWLEEFIAFGNRLSLFSRPHGTALPIGRPLRPPPGSAQDGRAR